MPRKKKVAAVLAETVTPDANLPQPAQKAAPAPADLLAGVARADMPALLAQAKREENKPLIAAILEACRH